MESNVHACDEQPAFAFTLSDVHFASQAPCVGPLGGVAMHQLLPPLSDRKTIGRQIMKEQIREEILAREAAERRILEEEVRRELEMERLIEMRRFHMDKFSVLSGTTSLVIHGDPPTQMFMPSWNQDRSGHSIERELVYDAREFAERSPSHMAAAQASIFPKPEKSSQFNKITPSNNILPGAKRKAHTAILPPAEKQWGCALCEVSSTSQKGLEEHLQGKKHKLKVLQSTKMPVPLVSKMNLASKSDTTSASGPNKKELPALKGASTSGPNNKELPALKRASISGPNNKELPALKCASTSGPNNKELPALKGASTSSPNDKKLPALQGASANEPLNKNPEPSLKVATSTRPKKKPQKLYCSLCMVKCNSILVLEHHRNGKKHKMFMEFKEFKDSMKGVETEAAKKFKHDINYGETGPVKKFTEGISNVEADVAKEGADENGCEHQEGVEM